MIEYGPEMHPPEGAHGFSGASWEDLTIRTEGPKRLVFQAPSAYEVFIEGAVTDPRAMRSFLARLQCEA